MMVLFRIVVGIVFLSSAAYLFMLDLIFMGFKSGTIFTNFYDGRLIIIASYLTLFVSAIFSFLSFRGIVNKSIKKFCLNANISLILLTMVLLAYYLFQDFEKLGGPRKDWYIFLTTVSTIVCISSYISMATLKASNK